MLRMALRSIDGFNSKIMKDCREEWYDAEKKVAVTIVDVTGAAQELCRGHLAGPTAAHYLTEALASVALLGGEMSEKDETVSLQMKCKGPLGGYNVECTTEGTLRGYTEKKVLDEFDGLGKPDDRKVLGERQIQVTRSVPGRILSQGISTSLDGYFAGSLQRRARLRTEVAVSDEVEVLEARGILVEDLPDSQLGSLGSDRVSIGSDRVGVGSDRVGAGSDSVGVGSDRVGVGSDRVGAGSDSVGVGSDRVSIGSDRVSIGSDRVGRSSGGEEETLDDPILTLMDPKHPVKLGVASRKILKQLGLEKAELRKTTPRAFACRCSPDRAVAMLAALSEEERKTLPPTIDITCHMCGKTFTVKV